MEGSASQRCTLRQRRMERCSGKTAQREREKEKGKRWSMWWKKWTNNERLWAIKKNKKRLSGRGTSERAPSGQHNHLQLAKTNRTPVFLPLLLDCLRKKTKVPLLCPHQILETKERKMLPVWQKRPFYVCIILFLSVYVLFSSTLARKQTAFLSDTSQCSHSAHTMDKCISLRQQGCQCNLWACWSESRLRAVQLGMLMDFSWGTELSGCSLTSLSSSFHSLTIIWRFKEEAGICEVVGGFLEHRLVLYCRCILHYTCQKSSVKVKEWVVHASFYLCFFWLITFQGFWSLTNYVFLLEVWKLTHHFMCAKRFFTGSGKSV